MLKLAIETSNFDLDVWRNNVIVWIKIKFRQCKESIIELVTRLVSVKMPQ